MSNVYVISDLHFGHRKMAKYRGFDSVEEHDQHIINSWNSVVTKNDSVWILGDITMEKKVHYELLSKLNGIKRVVLGNHDMPKPSHNQELLKYVNSLSGAVTDRKDRYVLTHIPVHPSELGRFGVNIHGHLHEEVIDDDRYINVCCERVDYKPVLLNEILKK